MDAKPTIALAHDYLTQRGGAERVVLALARAFPDAPLYTSLFEPTGTFPEFARADLHVLPLNGVAVFRRYHRLAFPFLAPAFSGLTIRADVLIASSSGWAHAARVSGRKIVYCHAPARWLYQKERYLGAAGLVSRAALASLSAPLSRWDQRAAKGADRYLANSSWIARAIKLTYGIEADVVPPPVTIDVTGSQQAPAGIEPGFVLCVSRLLPYKNVAAVVAAFDGLGAERLVVVGDGPQEQQLRTAAGRNVTFVGGVGDGELRWLYGNARCLITASYEDFGLTPLEAAAFGKPTVALRFGGFLDTIREGHTGCFFDEPQPDNIRVALKTALAETWNEAELRAHAATFSEDRFARRMHEIVDEELKTGSV